MALTWREPTARSATKYIKGLAIILFFVGLIVFQNVTGRRDKLRLLDLEAATRVPSRR